MGSTLRESFFCQHSPSGAHTQRGVGCSPSLPLQDPGLCTPCIQMMQVSLFPQTHPAKPKTDRLSPHDTAVHSAWREGAANKSVLRLRDVGSFPSQPALWQGLGLWVVNWVGVVVARVLAAQEAPVGSIPLPTQWEEHRIVTVYLSWFSLRIRTASLSLYFNSYKQVKSPPVFKRHWVACVIGKYNLPQTLTILGGFLFISIIPSYSSCMNNSVYHVWNVRITLFSIKMLQNVQNCFLKFNIREKIP